MRSKTKIAAAKASPIDSLSANEKLLMCAIYTGNLQIIKQLLIAKKYEGEDINLDVSLLDVTPLYMAITEGHVQIVKLLCKNGASLDNPRLLALAVSNSNLIMTELLLQYGANPSGLCTVDGKINPPLAYAIQNDDESAVRLLLKFKADPNVLDGIGGDSFSLAIEGGKYKLAKIILENSIYPIDLNTPFNGLTPIQGACLRDPRLGYDDEEESRLELINTMILRGANPLTCDRHGRNIIHLAAKSNNAPLIRFLAARYPYLLEAEEASNSHTPLEIAIYQQQFEALKCLIDLGADFANNLSIDGVSKRKKTPISLVIGLCVRPASEYDKAAWRPILNLMVDKITDPTKLTLLIGILFGAFEREVSNRELIKGLIVDTCFKLETLSRKAFIANVLKSPELIKSLSFTSQKFTLDKIINILVFEKLKKNPELIPFLLGVTNIVEAAKYNFNITEDNKILTNYAGPITPYNSLGITLSPVDSSDKKQLAFAFKTLIDAEPCPKFAITIGSRALVEFIDAAQKELDDCKAALERERWSVVTSRSESATIDELLVTIEGESAAAAKPALKKPPITRKIVAAAVGGAGSFTDPQEDLVLTTKAVSLPSKSFATITNIDDNHGWQLVKQKTMKDLSSRLSKIDNGLLSQDPKLLLEELKRLNDLKSSLISTPEIRDVTKIICGLAEMSGLALSAENQAILRRSINKYITCANPINLANLLLVHKISDRNAIFLDLEQTPQILNNALENPHISMRNIANILNNLGQLGYSNTELGMNIDNLSETLNRLLPSANIIDLAQVISGISNLGLLNQDFMPRIINQFNEALLRESSKKRGISYESAHALTQAEFDYRSLYKENLFVADTLTTISDRKSAKKQSNAEAMSHFQDNISRALEQIFKTADGYEVSREFALGNIDNIPLRNVDIVVKKDGVIILAIEADGPSHEYFSRGSFYKTGKTLMRDAVIESAIGDSGHLITISQRLVKDLNVDELKTYLDQHIIPRQKITTSDALRLDSRTRE